jgi:hypothetical protein
MNGFIDCKYCNQKITFSKTIVSKNGKMVPLDVDGTPHVCQIKSFESKKELKLQQYHATFERASDLRDRELIERSYVHINETNRQLMHSRLELIVKSKRSNS